LECTAKESAKGKNRALRSQNISLRDAIRLLQDQCKALRKQNTAFPGLLEKVCQLESKVNQVLEEPSSVFNEDDRDQLNSAFFEAVNPHSGLASLRVAVEGIKNKIAGGGELE